MSRHYSIPEHQSFVRLPKGVRPDTCRFIGHLFATDGRSIFSTRGALKDVDPAAFVMLEQHLEPDVDGSFASAHALTPHKAIYVDELHAPRFFAPKLPVELRVLAAHYATDGVAVYHDGVRIGGADPQSFRVLSPHHSADRKHCYFRSTRIDGADPATFRFPGELQDRHLHLSHDAAALYLCERPVVALSGVMPRLERGRSGEVVGVIVGERRWSLYDLDTILREALQRRSRAVVFSEESASLRFTEAMFAGLEDDVSVFLMLCSQRTIAGVEDFTRGGKGEQAIVRAIERLNDRLPTPLAIVSPATITVTAEGMAAYRQYGPVVDRISDVLALLKP